VGLVPSILRRKEILYLFGFFAGVPCGRMSSVTLLTEARMSDTFSTKPSPDKSAARVPRPRFGKIPAAMAYSGFGRTKLYEVASEHPGLFRKSGASTLVDFEFLDRVLDRLPAAAIKTRSSGHNA
jgi:hypothetical protein